MWFIKEEQAGDAARLAVTTRSATGRNGRGMKAFHAPAISAWQRRLCASP